MKPQIQAASRLKDLFPVVADLGTADAQELIIKIFAKRGIVLTKGSKPKVQGEDQNFMIFDFKSQFGKEQFDLSLNGKAVEFDSLGNPSFSFDLERICGDKYTNGVEFETIGKGKAFQKWADNVDSLCGDIIESLKEHRLWVTKFAAAMADVKSSIELNKMLRRAK